MNEEKTGLEEEEFFDEGDEPAPVAAAASRARNRTVMLTPEMTGQVRALLQHEPQAERSRPQPEPQDDFLPPFVSWDSAQNKDEVQDPYEEPDEDSRRGTGKLEHPLLERDTRESPKGVVADAYDPLTSIVPQFQAGGKGKARGGLPAATKEHPLPQLTRQPQPQVTMNPRVSTTAVPVAGPRAPRYPAESAQPRAKHPPVERTRLIGFLISYDTDAHGEVFEIRAGRWLITSRPTDTGEYILIPHETVSPLHAILRATKDGKIQILDQLSEHGTGVVHAGEDEEIDVAGGLINVGHGDTLRFGQRNFVICCVPEVFSREDKPEDMQ